MRYHSLVCRKLQFAGLNPGRGPVAFRRTRFTYGVVWSQPARYKWRQAHMLNDGSRFFCPGPCGS